MATKMHPYLTKGFWYKNQFWNDKESNYSPKGKQYLNSFKENTKPHEELKNISGTGSGDYDINF